VVLATKFHARMGDDPNERGNSRRWIVREVENSLRRLRTDWIDLYQVHRPDHDTDIDETLGALTDLVHAGKLRYIGSSTFPASEIVEAQWVAEKRGRERFVCEQPPYSLLVRGVEADVLPTCLRHGMGAIPWSPLAGGWLSGRYRKGADPGSSRRAAMVPSRYDMLLTENQRKLEAADAFTRLADDDADGRRARPHRRDRAAWRQREPGGRRLRQPGAEAGRAPPLTHAGPFAVPSPVHGRARPRDSACPGRDGDGGVRHRQRLHGA
jgi:aryl-alcohol dehydrogenase-like predicted oxidoreductase